MFMPRGQVVGNSGSTYSNEPNSLVLHDTNFCSCNGVTEFVKERLLLKLKEHNLNRSSI